MYRIIKKSNCPIHQVDATQSALNYINKELSPTVSLIVVTNTNSDKEYLADYQRIYYVLSGTMTLKIGEETKQLTEGDACFIQKGTSYQASGTYTVVVVNQPAYGSK